MPYLSPVGNEQQSDGNGSPLAGGFVYSYLAGTTTPVATYTDSTGGTAQANPITLNASGLPASPIWLPNGQAVKLVIQNAAGVTQRTVDNVTGINDPAGVASASEWVTYTGAPTYISASSFSVAGDQTGTFQANRRVKSTNSGGTRYGTISSASYAAGVTTVNVLLDSGALDAGLSQVAYGLMAATNRSLPVTVIDRAYAEYTTNASLSTLIPMDDTIPQNTEGTQVLSVSFTPKTVSNRVRLRFQCEAAASAGPSNVAAAIFSSASANALAATVGFVQAADQPTALVCEIEYVPGTTSALTYSARVGPQSGTCRLNGNTVTRQFGGSMRATLIVEEIAQ